MTDKEITITPSEFDIKRLVKSGLVKNEFKIGKSKTVTTYTTGYKYLNDEGVPCTLYTYWPKQSTFGPSYNFPIDEDDSAKPKAGAKPKDDDEEREERNPDEATGMQVQYPLTSMQTIDKPTKEEKALIKMQNEIHQKIYEDGLKEADDEDTLMPPISQNSFAVAAKKKNPSLAVKNFFNPRMEKHPDTGKKVIAKDKPQSAYLKIQCKGKKTTLEPIASFWGPGDRERSPIYFLGTRGFLTPTMRFDGAYHGAHGQNPQGTSIRWVLTEAAFTPALAAEKKRRGPQNTDPVDEDDASDEDESPKGKKTSSKAAASKSSNGGSPKSSKNAKKPSDSDDESGGFPLADGDSKTPLKSLSKKVTPPAKPGKKSKDSDDDSSTAPPPKKDNGAKPKKGEGKKSKGSDDDDSSTAPPPKKSEETKPKKGDDAKDKKSKTASKPVVAESDDDSSTAASKKASKKGEDAKPKKGDEKKSKTEVDAKAPKKGDDSKPKKGEDSKDKKSSSKAEVAPSSKKSAAKTEVVISDDEGKNKKSKGGKKSKPADDDSE